MVQKTNYFYIDETGHINNDSVVFVYGCIKTDTPNILSETLSNLKEELADDPILSEFGERVKQNNFHATADPFDIRTQMFRLMPHLNFRAYFTVLIKEGVYFDSLKSKFEDYQIIEEMLRKVVIRRLKDKGESYVFFFEELEVEKKSLKRIIESIFKNYTNNYNLEFIIVGKENETMPVVDYLSFVLNKILTADKQIDDWVIRAFEAMKDKIALIHFQNDDSYFSRKGKEETIITIENIIKKLVAVKG